MSTAAPSPASAPLGKSTFACVRCAERKVKCDRQRPCGACVNHNADCVFQPPRPPRRKDRHAKEQIITDRLKYYENLLQEHGIDPAKLPDTPGFDPLHRPSRAPTEVPRASHLQTPSSIESEASGSVSKTQFHDSEDVLEGSSSDSSDLEASENDVGFVLGGRLRKNRCRHPPPKRIHELWKIFIDSVDPLTKILHIPTLRPAIERAVGDIAAIPRSFEALMFAIYSTAVMSLNDEDCREKLGEPRKTLLWKYINATRAALSRARFMGTTSLVVLQALVLHLLSVRDIQEPRAVWSLTGVAIRIAEGLGLERDGVYMGLSPFETEMRRRIWWLLKTHDGRTAELCGLHKFRDLDIRPESTKTPTNVNDDQLYPSMSSLPPESNSLTDISFVALKYDLMNIAASRVARFRQQGKNISQWDRDLASESDKLVTDETLKEIESLIEVKYLRYCDPSQPLHLMIMLMGRCAINTIRFLTHHPRRWASIEQTPVSERQWVWEVSIRLLEQHNMLQSNPQLKRFSWQAAYVMQWHAFIHVLDTLRATPLIADAEKVWELIGSTYKNNPAMILDTRRHIHVAVGSLCLKAYGARARTLLHDKNGSAVPAPEFIIKLRQQNEAAKLKKESRYENNEQAINSPYHIARSGDIGFSDGGILESSLLDQRASFQEPRPTETADCDGFWFLDRVDNSRVSSFNDVVGTSQDLGQAQDRTREENDLQGITWEQWDAWLAEAMFPSS